MSMHGPSILARLFACAAMMHGVVASPAWADIVTENFDVDPNWQADGNTSSGNSFGWSNTNDAGGVLGAGVGEIGGTFDRGGLGRYSTDIGAIDPTSDALSLSGRGRFTGGSGGNSFLVWFDKDTSLSYVPDNMLGIFTDGPDVYLAYEANGANQTIIPISLGQGIVNSWDFSWAYDPNGNGGTGTVTASVAGGAPFVHNLPAGVKDAFADFDSFGLLSAFIPAGAGINITVFYDDLSYTTAPTLVPGDFDSDGDVDGADFVVWQTHFPTAGGATLGDGDADADGDVDGADFVVWQTNFPFTPSPGVTTVPEPASAMLVLVLGSIVALTRQRKRKYGTQRSA